MIISFNQFLLLKEFHYQDTFGKRDKFYLEWRRLMKNMNKSDKRRFMHLRELGVGTLETLKLMPGYEDAIEELKKKMEEEVKEKKKAKENGTIKQDSK